MRRDITLATEPRSERGKNAARRLRASAQIPAVVYGVSEESVPVAVSPRDVTKILHSSAGHNTIFNLDVQGSATPVMIVDWQEDPVRGSLLHVDFKRIDPNKRLHVKVPVHTSGDPKGVKQQGGLHDIVTREIEIDCLPDDIPEHFTVDVNELLIGQSIRAGDVPMSGSMKLLTPADTVISHVVALKAETPAAAGPEPVATTAEPEIIKKGKKEEEGGEGEKKKK
jgi:large subunit ribosomal protein L25